MHLEDRYDKTDLWVSQSVLGRWLDDEGRVFMLSRLDVEPPSADEHAHVTRSGYVGERVPMKRIRVNREPPAAFRQAISILAGCPLTEDRPRPSRQIPHGYDDVDYWQHPTNYSDIVCAFRLRNSERWYLATWKLVEGDDYAERMQAFDEKFLRADFKAFAETHLPDEPEGRKKDDERAHPVPSERELLRTDVRHSVAAYLSWHFSSCEEFAVIDDLATHGFIESLTNDFALMRARYAATLPTCLNVSNALSVARIYASRGEYVEALATDGCTNMFWTAAYWSPERRELVAYLPADGADGLLKTIRHEAFHQYLSYAASMISTSPWLNEGYAQYFEDAASENWGADIEITPETIDRLALALPGLFGMDYQQFYAGTDEERRMKYRMAWSIAVFLEKGADKVRFKPFKNLKNDYFDALFRTKDMRMATTAAFGSEDVLKLFVSEWKKFWKNR